MNKTLIVAALAVLTLTSAPALANGGLNGGGLNNGSLNGGTLNGGSSKGAKDASHGKFIVRAVTLANGRHVVLR